MEHLRPVWAEHADAGIVVRIPDVEDALEHLAVRRLGEDVFEVCCLPFSLYNVGLGDHIRVAGLSPTAPGTVADRVMYGGRYLFRVALAEDEGANMDSVASAFLSMGFLVEEYGPVLLAVDAPDKDAADALAAYLQAGQDAGDWEYETGQQ